MEFLVNKYSTIFLPIISIAFLVTLASDYENAAFAILAWVLVLFGALRKAWMPLESQYWFRTRAALEASQLIVGAVAFFMTVQIGWNFFKKITGS